MDLKEITYLHNIVTGEPVEDARGRWRYGGGINMNTLLFVSLNGKRIQQE
jgi:hypothetical protein